MASKASIIARKRAATERFEKACQAFAKFLNVELPPTPEYAGQDGLDYTNHVERVADLLELAITSGKLSKKGR